MDKEPQPHEIGTKLWVQSLIFLALLALVAFVFNVRWEALMNLSERMRKLENKVEILMDRDKRKTE